MKVSIIIIAYKKPLIIKEVVKYCVDQNFDQFEVIVVNNNVEGTSEYLFVKEQCDFFANVVMVCTNRLVNANTARNFGVGFARGEYVKFMDDDDFLFPDALSILYALAIQTDGDVAFGRIVHKEANLSTKIMFAVYNVLMYLPNFIYFRSNMQVRLLCTQRISVNPNTLSTLIKKSFLLACGGLDESFDKADDAELFIRLARTGKFVESKQKIGIYFHQAKAVNPKSKNMALTCTLRIVENNLDVISEFNLFKKIACFYHYFLFDLPFIFSLYEKKLFKLIFGSEEDRR